MEPWPNYCARNAGVFGMTESMALKYLQQPLRITGANTRCMATTAATRLRPSEETNIDLIKRSSGMRKPLTRVLP